MTFRCAKCNQDHDLAEISFGADAPAQWSLLSDAERERSELYPEQCLIRAEEGETHFFIRAALEIPVRGRPVSFTWGVWASLSEASFVEMSEHWEDPGRVELGPYFGWLSTAIPGYPDTMFLKTRVRQRAVGLRPLVEVDSHDHPLGIQQRHGAEPAWLEALVQDLLHT